MKVFDPLDW